MQVQLNTLLFNQRLKHILDAWLVRRTRHFLFCITELQSSIINVECQQR